MAAVAHPHHGVDIAARIEIRLQLHPHRVGRRHQVIEDAVGHLLMGDGLIAVAVHVQLDRLELHHPGAGLIDQAQHGEIGIAGEGALAGELRQLDRHLVGAAGPGIVKADQFRLRDRPLAVERSEGLLIGGGQGKRCCVYQTLKGQLQRCSVKLSTPPGATSAMLFRGNESGP